MKAAVSTHTTLLRRLATGNDQLAWDEFVQRYGAVVRAVAHRHGLQPADADDVLQDTLIGLTRSLPGFEYNPQTAKFRTYLKSIVQRIIFQRFRQKQSTVGIELLGALPAADEADAIWDTEWRQHHLRLAMETIEIEFSSRDRLVFTLYVGSQQPPGSIADELGISIDLVYKIKSRIMKRLESVIAAQVEEEG